MAACRFITFLALWFGVQGARLREKRNKGLKVKSLTSCGVKGASPADVNGTIVGGQPATECEWRWQVSLWKDDPLPFCGGMLITPEWVLTAAHCAKWPNFHVVTGDYSFSKMANEQIRLAVQVIRHPDYGRWGMSYDVALVRVQTPFEINNCVGTVCLPTEGADVPAGSTCWITGFGTLEAGGSRPDLLQEAQVGIISNDDCVKNAGYEEHQIHTSMICAAGKNSSGGTTDACQGDSGGPLVCESDGQWTAYGATSWGNGCAWDNWPGVWSRVHDAVGWVDETLEANTGPPPTWAACPWFARWAYPDPDGDCVCGINEFCSRDGKTKNCPTSGQIGGWGGIYFKATCEDCQCYNSPTALDNITKD